MTENRVIFYHVTTVAALKQILSSAGIDPAVARGKRRVAWYVTRDNVSWAIAHVIARHKAQISEIVVCKVRGYRHYFQLYAQPRLYGTKIVLMPDSYDSAVEWLLREERQIHKQETLLAEVDWYGHLK